MTPVEALQLALTKEQSAIVFYERLAMRYSGIKDLLSFLLTEEQKHKQMIEKKIAELTLI